MNDSDKIAILIDADNTQLQKLDAIMTEISTRGRIVVKRAYGNWKKRNLNKWENELKRLGIKAEQQFDYVSGKNATDMALVIDAMDLLSSNAFDSFVIVSSDSDFTPLAIRLHESGANIVGIGVQTTPESFRNACDDFLFLEKVGDNRIIIRLHDVFPASGDVHPTPFFGEPFNFGFSCFGQSYQPLSDTSIIIKTDNNVKRILIFFEFLF